MKIEKVNDNQIRCTLTREDLADRQIKLSELAYGSDKAKMLFRDMIQQANYEFGFEVNDIPLMVEAIPMSSESIILVITKVEYPDELDTRFSKFSEPDDEYLADGEAGASNDYVNQGADDILDLFRKIRKESEKEKSESVEKETAEAPKKDENTQEVVPEVVTDLTKMFEFKNLDQVERLSHVLEGYYEGKNDLYKDEQKNRFYLMIHKSKHTPVEFNKVCNIISEYAYQKNYTSAVGAYFSEHGKMIIKDNALQVLASI